jgi:hypothetical protein
MKNFKEFINENYEAYLDMPHTKKFQAEVIVTDKDGKEHTFPIGSDDNIRAGAHLVVAALKQKGFTLKDMKYKV